MSKYTIRSGASAHPESIFLAFLSALVSVSGVLSKLSGAILVTAQSPEDMAVDIAAGVAYLTKNGTARPIIISASEPLSITPETSGNDRIDAVVLYIDLAVSPNSDASNVAKITAVEGTPAASPTAPSDSDIETAIGASNPYLRLANIDVANAATEIYAADITDMRQEARWGMVPRNAIIPLTYAATTHIYADEGSKFEITLTGNVTFEFENLVAGDVIDLRVLQDGTGSRTITWDSGMTINWVDGAEPDVSTDPSVADRFIFIARSATELDGFKVGGPIS